MSGKRLAIQEYGPSPKWSSKPNLKSEALRYVPYRSTLGPYRKISNRSNRPSARCANRQADAALFTSAKQLDHIFEVADSLKLRDALTQALKEHTVLASIGPITSEALAHYGLKADLEPEHPKMGHLVLSLASKLDETLTVKRS